VNAGLVAATTILMVLVGLRSDYLPKLKEELLFHLGYESVSDIGGRLGVQKAPNWVFLGK
jgi:hypothetical protein